MNDDVDGRLKNCWEICCCERQENGEKVAELGECIASREFMGHSCWVLTGTLGCGRVQGTAEEKEAVCSNCEVYMLYHRGVGTERRRVSELYPEEDMRYSGVLIKNMSNRYKFLSNYNSWALAKR
ncbi:MAG: hypothetical protein OEV64_14455 [Desulfobulbaceae bacterium]|nr:hypothetical protein [Desulfobulbaceae bacterium]